MTTITHRYPMPGQQISVGSHHLHIQSCGEGTPAVVLEAGMAGFSMDWLPVMPEVAPFARVVTYDRAGTGWSEGGSEARTPAQIVAELHTLLTGARIPPPYLFVAHSLGARYARWYAHMYPDELAGLVLVDPDQEYFGALLGEEKYGQFVKKRVQQYALVGVLSRMGLVRLSGKNLLGLLIPEMKSAPADVRQRYIELAARPEAIQVAIDEYRQAVAADEALKAIGLPATIPVTTLTHGIPWPYPEYERCWQEGIKQLMAMAPQGTIVVAEKSGHSLMLSQPGLIVDAIRQIVALYTHP